MSSKTLWMLKSLACRLRDQAGEFRREIGAWRRFWASYREFSRMAPLDRRASLDNLYPCLFDATEQTPVEPTYFYQDTWAFQKIVNRRPEHHVDVGSHHLFVAYLSMIVPVTMVDIRPLSVSLDTIHFRQGSILNLPYPDGSVSSLSSLCVIEHIGLGRYGDELDPQGSEKAVGELKRVLAPGGRSYVSTPLGDKDIVAFNAHRIFSLDQLLKLFEPLVVVEQRFVVGNSLLDRYKGGAGMAATGLFELTKPLHSDQQGRSPSRAAGSIRPLGANG
jgi:SAM-dependent methyltransferase